MRGPSMRCEEECIAYCKVGKMDIRFNVVNNLATEIGVHDRGAKPVYVEVGERYTSGS